MITGAVAADGWPTPAGVGVAVSSAAAKALGCESAAIVADGVASGDSDEMGLI
jgi:hypothetical protein